MKSRIRKNFNPEEISLMLDLYEEGKTISEIARIMNRLPATIRNNLIKRGVYIHNWRKRRFTKKETELIIKLFRQGNTFTQIGMLTNRTVDTIRKRLILEGVYS